MGNGKITTQELSDYLNGTLNSKMLGFRNLLDPSKQSFSRASNAARKDLTPVPYNVLRTEQGKYGQGAFIEESTTNLVYNSDFETFTGTATVFSDPLTSGTAWTTQSGSFTYSASGATSGANGAYIIAGNSAWKPLVGSNGSQLQLYAFATFTTPAVLSTGTNGLVRLFQDSNNMYEAYINNNTFILAKIVGGTYTLITSGAVTLSANTAYTIQLAITNTSGSIVANLYSGTGTGGANLKSLSTTDTSLAGGFLIGVGGDTGVVIKNAQVTAPFADGWSVNGQTTTTTTTTTTYDHSTPATVVASAYDTSGNDGRKLVRLSNGNLIAGMYSSGDTTVKFYKSTDNGATWAYLTQLTSVTSYSGLAMATDGTYWYNMIGALGTSIQVRKYDASGTLITSNSNVDSSQTATGGVSLAIDSNGKLWAAWASKNSTYTNSFNIRVSSSTDGGTTWATPTQVTTYNTSGQDYKNPTIVINSSNLPVVIGDYNYTNTTNGIIAAKYNGSSWQTSITVYAYASASNYTQSNPSAVVDSVGNIHVAWHGTDVTDTTANNIRYSKSPDGGATWSVMTKLTSGNSYHQSYPSITADNNNIYVIWQGVDASALYQIKKVVYSGSTWGSVVTLTSNTTVSASYPATLANYTQFTDPLTIYQDNQAGAVKFRGVYSESSTTTVTTSGDQRCAWALTATNPISGSYSVSAVGVAGVQGVITSNNPSATAGNAYTASGYIATTNMGNGGAFIAVGWYNSTPASISANSTSVITGTNGQARNVVTATAPVNTVSAKITLNVQDAGTAIFDAIQLEQKAYATTYVRNDSTSTSVTRQADLLTYILSNPLPSRHFGALMWKPEQASSVSVGTGNIRVLLYQFVKGAIDSTQARRWIQYNSSSGTFRFAKKNLANVQTNLDSSAISFNAGDNIFIAWLDDPTSGFMYLWISVNGGILQQFSVANTDMINDAQLIYTGGFITAGNECNGTIDFPIITDILPTADQVQALYQASDWGGDRNYPNPNYVPGQLTLGGTLTLSDIRTRIKGFDASNNHWLKYSADDSDLIFRFYRNAANDYRAVIRNGGIDSYLIQALSGGYKVQSGSTGTVNANAGATVTFPTPFNSIVAVIVTPTAGSGANIYAWVGNQTASNFTFYSNSTAVTGYNWIAIGS